MWIFSKSFCGSPVMFSGHQNAEDWHAAFANTSGLVQAAQRNSEFHSNNGGISTRKILTTCATLIKIFEEG